MIRENYQQALVYFGTMVCRPSKSKGTFSLYAANPEKYKASREFPGRHLATGFHIPLTLALSADYKGIRPVARKYRAAPGCSGP
jgi:hypothetical protein